MNRSEFNFPHWSEHPRLLARSPLMWGGIGLVLLFAVLALLADHTVLSLISHSMRFFFSVAVAVAYAPAAYYFILEGTPYRGGYLTVGIWLSWSMEALFGLRGMAYRLMGKPGWMVDTIDIPLLILLSGAAAVMHLTAGAIKEGEREVPRRQWIMVGIFSAAAGAFGLGLGILATHENWVGILTNQFIG